MAVSIAVVRPGAMTSVGSPATEHNIRWRTEKNGTGSGQFTIAMDDPLYGDIQINDVAKISRDSDLVAAILIEKIHERTLAENGAGQTATYMGRLVGAFLEWAVIAPALGDQHKPIEDDAIFDWRSPRYDEDDDPWEASFEIMTVTAAKGGGWPTTPMGEDFTDSTGAYMIWHDSGDETDAPVGTCLFLLDVNITSPGRHGLEVLMDNDGYVWVDSVEQLEISQTEGYHRASFKRLQLTEGIHRFAFQVRNINGPAALAFNLFKSDHQDRPLPGVSVVAISDMNTLVLEYPDPFPGMTVGDDLLQLIGEAQARGAITWIDPTFTAELDSDGAAWDFELGITTKTGTTTLLQFLDELVASGRISRWRMHPDGITLDVFAPGHSTRPGDVVLEPAPVTDPTTGQLVELNRVIT